MSSQKHAFCECPAHNLITEDQQEARSHGQELLDRFVSDPRFANGPTSADASIELMSGPERDELAQALDVQKKTLAEERNRYTEATIKLGREKANLEVCVRGVVTSSTNKHVPP